MSKVSQLSDHPQFNPKYSGMVADALQDNDGIPRYVVDPRIERTADAMYETDLSIAKVQKSINDFFSGDDPEAA